jgi:hypothetical protein
VSRLLRTLVLATIGTLMLAAIAMPATAGSRSLKLFINVDNGCVEGQGRPRERFVVRLRAPDGTIRRRVEGRSDRWGEFVACRFHGQDRIRRGDLVLVRAGQVRRQVRIPTAVPSIDLETDVVSGRAPLGSRLQVVAVDRHQTQFGLTKTADDGRWSYDFASQMDLTANTAILVGVVRRGITVEAWIQTP